MYRLRLTWGQEGAGSAVSSPGHRRAPPPRLPPGESPTPLPGKTKYKQLRIILRTRCLFTFQNCRYGRVLRPTTAINNNLGQSLLGEAASQFQRQKPIFPWLLCSGTCRLFISSQCPPPSAPLPDYTSNTCAV